MLPQDLKTLNDHSKSLVREFPKIDQVAELALRKFKARGGAGGGASGQVPLTADNNQSQLKNASPIRANLSAEGRAAADKDLLPSQQLDKYITTTLSQRKVRQLNKLISQRVP